MRSADEKPVGLTWPKPRRYRRSDPEDRDGGGGCPEVVDVGEDGPLRMRRLGVPEVTSAGVTAKPGSDRRPEARRIRSHTTARSAFPLARDPDAVFTDHPALRGASMPSPRPAQG